MGKWILSTTVVGGAVSVTMLMVDPLIEALGWSLGWMTYRLTQDLD